MTDLTGLAYLPYPALYDGYGYSTVPTHRSNKTKGGLPRSRRTASRATLRTTAKWTLDGAAYTLLVGFFEHVTANGLPFQVDAIAESGVATRCKAYFVPGTLQQTALLGGSFSVTAQMEVHQNQVDAADDEFTLLRFASYGVDQDELLNLLAQLANQHVAEMTYGD